MDNKNLFSIGEIAKAVGITRKIILNYEAKGLIQPDKKDGNIGNRYYTIDTFTQIRTIRVFQNLGLSLDEIREYFNDTSDLQPTIKRLETMRDELNLTIEKLKERTHKTNDTIKEITIEPQTIYIRTYNTATFPELMDRKKSDIMEWTKTNPKLQEEFSCQSKREQYHLVMMRHSKPALLKWSLNKGALQKRLPQSLVSA